MSYNLFQRREQEESDIIRAKVESKKEQEEEARRRKEKEVFPRTVKEIQRPNTEVRLFFNIKYSSILYIHFNLDPVDTSPLITTMMSPD